MIIKKAIVLILSVLPFIASAQQGVGSWTMIPSFGSFEKVIDASDKVYFLTSTKALYSYDKNSEEIYNYGIDNKLTEAAINAVYYNKFKGYLAVAYESSSIDILFDNGKVKKLTDIRDASIASGKEIVNISFAPGYMLVQTKFGLVLYDSDSLVVKDSGIYNDSNILGSAVTENFIVYSYQTDNSLYYLPITKRLNNQANFEKANIGNIWSSRLEYVNPTTVAGAGRSQNWIYATYDIETKKGSIKSQKINNNVIEPASMTPTKNGVTVYSKDNMVSIDKYLNVVVTPLPAALNGYSVSAWNGLSEVWAGTSDGLGAYNLSNGAADAVVTPFRPNGLVESKVGQIYVGKSGNIYVAPYGYSHSYTYNDWSYTQAGYISIIQPDGNIVDGTMYNGTKMNGNTGRIDNVYSVIEHPTLDNQYLFGSLYDGMHIATEGTETNFYNNTNSTLVKVTSSWLRALALDFDSKNNLWVLNDGRNKYSDNGETSLIHELTADKLDKNPTEVSDWQHLFDGMIAELDGRLLACKRSNIVMAGYYNCQGIAFVDSKGTPSTSDDVTKFITNFYDQDGKIVNIVQPLAIVEDKNGQVWVGHSTGVFSITNPSKFNDADFRINHIKVPRNDGTNFADYLLDNQTVTSITVDSANRKWIGTLESGVYLVSPNGSEILEHFTTENSYIPDDKVYAVAYDDKTGSIYIGGLNGLARYTPDSAPSADDFSEILAYPNPVRPDYNGWIIVKGLMDNSLVKIADAAGNVVFQGTSKGGSVSWDGCDTSGRRVKTGVYYVFASVGGDNITSQSAVTKILVVR